MKFISSFSKFLDNTVNLNSTRVNVADASISTITDILKASEVFKNNFVKTQPQGSLRQRTIIKPPKIDIDFDVDLLFEMRQFDGWEPSDYLNNLADEFREMDRYKDKVDTRGKNRCITIDYESDFHIDVVPSIQVNGTCLIMNKETNRFEQTDGDGYALWFEKKGKILGGDNLASVVRLLKYIRDAKGSFEVKSILLTTLVGHQVLESDVQNINYPDIPTSFLTIISRLDTFLQGNEYMPSINNPVLLSENFNRKWDQAKYSKFRTKIHEYAVLAMDAHVEADETKSLEKWRRIFGDKFTGDSNSSLTISTSSFLPVPRIAGVIVGDYTHREVLSDIRVNDPGSYPLEIKISASLYWGRADHKEMNRTYKGTFSSGAQLEPNHWLKYELKGDLEPNHKIYWQVVNTGPHARSWQKLRGEIKLGSFIQWEPSLFTGVHWIESFVVDSRTNTCVGRSGPFYVVFKNSAYPYIESEWS